MNLPPKFGQTKVQDVMRTNFGSMAVENTRLEVKVQIRVDFVKKCSMEYLKCFMKNGCTVGREKLSVHYLPRYNPVPAFVIRGRSRMLKIKFLGNVGGNLIFLVRGPPVFGK